MMSAEQGGRTVDEQLEAVQRMQDYIRGHLYGEITLADLARVSLYSPWYAHRLFQRWTGLTPSRYIRRLRLSESALRLRDRGGRIADAAFEMGFGSVDGYQRAFMREFGVNPGEYALHPSPIYLFTPYGVSYAAPGKEAGRGTGENGICASGGTAGAKGDYQAGRACGGLFYLLRRGGLRRVGTAQKHFLHRGGTRWPSGCQRR